MLISIIIPTFNRRHLLCQSIESVVQQTNKNWELIIVDDGSKDGTGEQIKKYLKDDRISYWYQAHQGASIARNTGIERAKGSYIIFLDSDDTLHSELISTLSCLNMEEYDLICWEVLKYIDNRKTIWKPRKMGNLYNNIEASFLAGSVCYKKSLIREIGGFDPKMSFGENYELGLRISYKDNLEIKIINKPLSTYNISTKLRTSNSYNNRLISGFHKYEKHRQIYDQYPKEKAKINYILGFLLQKLGNKKMAIMYYRDSWRSNPFSCKTSLRIIYLLVFK